LSRCALALDAIEDSFNNHVVPIPCMIRLYHEAPSGMKFYRRNNRGNSQKIKARVFCFIYIYVAAMNRSFEDMEMLKDPDRQG
jgi:hypothetical protein